MNIKDSPLNHNVIVLTVVTDLICTAQEKKRKKYIVIMLVKGEHVSMYCTYIIIMMMSVCMVCSVSVPRENRT